MFQQKCIQQIPLEKIVSGKQVRERFDEESLGGLAQSLLESGQHEPVHVLPLDGERFSLLTGGRRLQAARKAGWTTIAAIVEDVPLSKGEILVRQIIENAQREDLTPIEKAKGLDALRTETRWSGTQIAAKLGLANGTVSKLLALLQLPDEIQHQISAGELPVSAAYELTKLNDPENQKKIASEAASGNLTRDGVAVAVKAKKRRPPRAYKRRAIRVTAKLENRETVSVGAESLDLDSFVLILEKLLAHAVRARADGLTLETLIKRLTASRSAAKPVSQTVPCGK